MGRAGRRLLMLYWDSPAGTDLSWVYEITPRRAEDRPVEFEPEPIDQEARRKRLNSRHRTCPHQKKKKCSGRLEYSSRTRFWLFKARTSEAPRGPRVVPAITDPAAAVSDKVGRRACRWDMSEKKGTRNTSRTGCRRTDRPYVGESPPDLRGGQRGARSSFFYFSKVGRISPRPGRLMVAPTCRGEAVRKSGHVLAQFTASSFGPTTLYTSGSQDPIGPQLDDIFQGPRPKSGLSQRTQRCARRQWRIEVTTAHRPQSLQKKKRFTCRGPRHQSLASNKHTLDRRRRDHCGKGRPKPITTFAKA